MTRYLKQFETNVALNETATASQSSVFAWMYHLAQTRCWIFDSDFIIVNKILFWNSQLLFNKILTIQILSSKSRWNQ